MDDSISKTGVVRVWWDENMKPIIIVGVVMTIAVISLIIGVSNSGPSEAEQNLITYAHSVGIHPLDDQTIINYGNLVCKDPNSISTGIALYDMYGHKASPFVSYVVSGDYCEQQQS